MRQKGQTDLQDRESQQQEGCTIASQMVGEWECSCGWWKWLGGELSDRGSDPDPSDCCAVRIPHLLIHSLTQTIVPRPSGYTVTLFVNMQRFRPQAPKFGEGRWKKTGPGPMNLDKTYAPFRETYPMQIRNWVLGAGKNVKREYCPRLCPT